MRTFFILCLFSFSAFAQETFEDKLKALEKAREDAVYQARVRMGRNKLPNDKFVQEHNEAWVKFGEAEQALYDDVCKTDPTKCLTPEKKTELQAQVRIATGLMTAKNSWAAAGKTESEQKTAEDNFNRCAKENKDCDKLPENDRRVLDDSRKPANDEPEKREDDKKDDEPVVVTVATEITDGEKAVDTEIKAMIDEFAKTHPDWESKVTAEVLDFVKGLEKARLEKTLAMYKALCEKHPGDESVCLSEAKINELKDESAAKECLYDRKHAWFATPSDKRSADAPESGLHLNQWKDLPVPRSCQTLLDHDKEQNEKPKERVEEEGDDEKSPRNYKAETCKWVSDLPRKIVNGPGCGPKARSKICTGYVVCEQKEGGGKFIRMSTCGPDKCGGTDADAVRCTKDMGYFSQKPASESKLFMTPKLKKILSGGASEQ